MSQQRGNGEKILVTRSFMPSHEEYIEMIRPIWDNAWLTNMGDSHKRLEQKPKDYTGVSNLVLSIDGHMASEMVIQALNLTGEVTTTPLIFASTTHAIACNGLTSIFCDTNPLNYTMDVEQIESLITDKASATIPVYMYGDIYDVERIDVIAKKHGLKVIYDAAHTSGERYRGKSVAELGDASIFSFHAAKVFSTIEGGAVSFTGEWVDRKLNCLKNCGVVDQDHVAWVDGNAKMNKLQVATGLCNPCRLGDEIEERKMVTERYHENLGGVPGPKLPAYKGGLTSSYACFPIVFDRSKADRNEAYDRLAEHDIFLRKCFYLLTNGSQCYPDWFSPEGMPVAAYMADRVLTLPLYAGLSSEQVDRVCRVMKSI